ncbi:SMAD/FHA domain-containing protein [Backusella circina FSU 941]|nr:SMAD/FHA domain-containing protein [Backusella circina FSU 941]
MKTESDEFGQELDAYISSQNNADWAYDTERNVYVMHDKKAVMYYMNGMWIHGDYDSIYSDRYVYDAETDVCTMTLRLVVLSSPHFEKDQVVLIDENGITIGRDRSWDRRLRLPEMMVSKYHCTIFLNKEEEAFFIVDIGSQHGTLVNLKRLSEAKQSSMPLELHHLDIISVGSTQLQVHLHETGWPCQFCVAQNYIETTQGKKDEKKVQQPITVDLEQSRREWLKQAKRFYLAEGSQDENREYIDRADIRRKTVPAEKPSNPTQQERSDDGYTQQQYERVTMDTPVQGKGQQMLQKLGWQPGQALGKDQDQGIKVPIRPVAQTSKQGLGSTVIINPENETKKQRHWRLAQERFNQAQ